MLWSSLNDQRYSGLYFRGSLLPFRILMSFFDLCLIPRNKLLSLLKLSRSPFSLFSLFLHDL